MRWVRVNDGAYVLKARNKNTAYLELFKSIDPDPPCWIVFCGVEEWTCRGKATVREAKKWAIDTYIKYLKERLNEANALAKMSL